MALYYAEDSVTVSAQNQWTNWVTLTKGELRAISISGLTDSTVTLQRRFDEGTARTVDTWPADAEENYICAASGEQIRIGVATGDYGTDTPTLAIKD